MFRFRNGKILSSRKKKCFNELTTVYFMYRFCDCIYFQSNLPETELAEVNDLFSVGVGAIDKLAGQ